MKAKIIFIIFLFISFIAKPQGSVISTAYDNVIYKGIDNSLEYAIPNLSCNQLFLTADNGNVKKIKDCAYSIHPDTIGITTINICKLVKKDTIIIDSKKFHVKEIPNPIPYLANKNGGRIKKSQLKAQRGILAVPVNIGPDFHINISSFNVIISSNKLNTSLQEYTGHLFTDELFSQLGLLESGDRIYFVNIHAQMIDGRDVLLNAMEFTVE